MTEAIEASIEWIYKIMITIVLAAIVLGIVGGALLQDLNTHKVQRDLLLNKILYSPSGLWASENDIVQPGVIDLAFFSDQQKINEEFQYKTNYGGALLTLQQKQDAPIERYINEQTYKTLKTQADANIAKGGKVYVYAYPVLIKTANSEENGLLIVTLAVPERT